jgi:hypothetical protein
MRALKLLVIGMAVVIVVATAALVTIIVQRAGTLRAPAAATADRPIAVPLGFRVTATELSGDRLLVRLEGREPGAAADEIRLLTIDLDRGNAQRIVRLIVPPPEQGR